jgi:predicted lipoprotein with Yx(FWY)xxD motif
MRRHRPWTFVPAALLVVALAGCGSDEPEQSDTPPAADTTSEEETTSEDMADDEATTTEEMAAGTQVMTAESDLGTILVDGEGMTLYLFTNDTQGSGTSTCEGDCLTAWPPVEGEPEAGEGADDSLLGSIERSDGTVQATYNDWPLYYFAQDAAPGDVNGQALNDVWWVISPDGEAIMDAATSSVDQGYDY